MEQKAVDTCIKYHGIAVCGFYRLRLGSCSGIIRLLKTQQTEYQMVI